MKRKYPKICLVAFFTHRAFFIPLSHIREIIVKISPEFNSIIAVSPELTNKMTFDIEKDDVIISKNRNKPLLRMINYFSLNLKISWSIFLRLGNVDSFLFFMDVGLPLPMTIVKLCNKQIIWLLPSSVKDMNEYHHENSHLILILSQSLSYKIADKIVLYSPNLIKEWKLHKYSNKIFFARHHFITINAVTDTIPLCDRPLLIGCIGRMRGEKGIQNFVRALPAILNERNDISVLIGGDGPLKDEIEAFLLTEKLTSHVNLVGWITDNDLPEYLNKLRLLIIPSYTEGLPNILLEAIACCTPVLSTPVGAISDIIKDGETGFIMENNSPNCIAENIIRALDDPNLEKITINSKKFVEKEFTFDNTVKQWKRIVDEDEHLIMNTEWS